MSSRRPLEGVEELYGTWKLVSWTRLLVDAGETLEPFGEAPTGFLSYGREGRVFFMMTKQDRTRPSDLTQLTDTDRAELYNTIVAYGGTFTFDGQRAIHNVDLAWNEVWSGTAQVRNLVMDGQNLVMSTNPQAGIDGRRSTGCSSGKGLDSAPGWGGVVPRDASRYPPPRRRRGLVKRGTGTGHGAVPTRPSSDRLRIRRLPARDRSQRRETCECAIR